MDFASELAKKLNVPGAAPAQDSGEEEEERAPVKEVKETKRKGQGWSANRINLRKDNGETWQWCLISRFHLQNSVLDASKVMKNYACLRNIIQF